MAGPCGGGGWAPRDPLSPKRGPSELAGCQAWREDCLLHEPFGTKFVSGRAMIWFLSILQRPP
uniref:Uncharacterized protein n=1 Tax=Oryza barthii TaxID=65489 RepID=A0A0D3H6B9_9ORYZ